MTLRSGSRQDDGRPMLQGIVQEAQSRMEAEPYVKKFLASARAALQAVTRRDQTPSRRKSARWTRATPSSPRSSAPGAARRGPPRRFRSGLRFAVPRPHPGRRRSNRRKAIRASVLFSTKGRRRSTAATLQGAIDAWSRIFLIDIDHQEASRRIDQARKSRPRASGRSRRLPRRRRQAGSRRRRWRAAGVPEVLKIQPGYFAAREYLQQLDAGKMPVRPRPARSARRDGRGARIAASPRRRSRTISRRRSWCRLTRAEAASPLNAGPPKPRRFANGARASSSPWSAASSSCRARRRLVRLAEPGPVLPQLAD